MYFNRIFISVLSTALVVKVVGQRFNDNNNIPSIGGQVTTIGDGNSFCLFAYNGWVKPDNIQQDVPSAGFAGVSRLPYYRLDFNFYSSQLNGNIPTIVPDCGYEVWGSAYLIPVQDENLVLIKGGVVDNQQVFDLVETVVEVYTQGSIVNVKCYAFQQTNLPNKLIYGLPLPNDRRPSQQVLDVLTDAYTNAGLPSKYIEEISQLPIAQQGYLQNNVATQTPPQGLTTSLSTSP